MTISRAPLVVLLHHCISQEMVAQQLEEPPAKKCTCREIIPYSKSKEMVKNREARNCVVKRERGKHSVTCTMCGGDPEVKNCAKCAGLGAIDEPVIWDTYTDHIVLVSQGAADPKEKKYRPALALKTPRVATIESKHIIRAYADDNLDAADRIEEYGMLILKEQLRMLAKNISNEEFDKAWEEYTAEKEEQEHQEPPRLLVPIREEPDDNAKTGEGRRYDYGRAI
jgi:hypothetical protein